MLSQTVCGYEPINHSVIGPAPVIIHPEPLISADVKRIPHKPPYLLTVCNLSEHLLIKVN